MESSAPRAVKRQQLTLRLKGECAGLQAKDRQPDPGARLKHLQSDNFRLGSQLSSSPAQQLSAACFKDNWVAVMQFSSCCIEPCAAPNALQCSWPKCASGRPALGLPCSVVKLKPQAVFDCLKGCLEHVPNQLHGHTAAGIECIHAQPDRFDAAVKEQMEVQSAFTELRLVFLLQPLAAAA